MLDLFEAFHGDHKKRGSLFTRWQRRQFFADQIERTLHTLIAHPDQERDHAAPQKSPGGGNPGHTIFLRGESLGDLVCVIILDDEDDHFHKAGSWRSACDQISSKCSTGKAKTVAPPTVTGTG